MTDLANKLAEDHWSYIKTVLDSHAVKGVEVEVAEFHYKTAFIHGFKHGVEHLSDLLNSTDRSVDPEDIEAAKRGVYKDLLKTTGVNEMKYTMYYPSPPWVADSMIKPSMYNTHESTFQMDLSKDNSE